MDIARLRAITPDTIVLHIIATGFTSVSVGSDDSFGVMKTESDAGSCVMSDGNDGNIGTVGDR